MPRTRILSRKIAHMCVERNRILLDIYLKEGEVIYGAEFASEHRVLR
jgi:hypothetical protein